MLDNNVVKSQFHLGTFNDAFLHRVLCYEPEHSDLLHLTNPVSPVLRRQPITTHLQPSVNRAQTTVMAEDSQQSKRNIALICSVNAVRTAANLHSKALQSQLIDSYQKYVVDHF